MELKVFILVIIVLSVKSFSIVSSVSLRQLSERMDLLELRNENRFDYEQSKRHEDFASIMTKFGLITNRMDTLEKRLSLSDVNMNRFLKHITGDSKDSDLKQSDMLKYLLNGLQEEKKTTRIMEREILRLGSAIRDVSNIRPASETNAPSSPEKTRTEPASFKSCKDALSKGYKTDGVYKINGFDRYCDQTTDGGGWTVFQRRINGVVDFDRDWKSYKEGFGDISGEFWLGNDYLGGEHNPGYHELRIDIERFEENRTYAKYSRFRIDPESNNYTLHVAGYSGDAKDQLRFHDGYKFSTKDMDLDAWEDGSCAQKHSGGWWFRNLGCLFSNLNGKYYISRSYTDGIIWSGLYHLNPPKFVEMKFR